MLKKKKKKREYNRHHPAGSGLSLPLPNLLFTLISDFKEAIKQDLSCLSRRRQRKLKVRGGL